MRASLSLMERQLQSINYIGIKEVKLAREKGRLVQQIGYNEMKKKNQR